MSERLFRREPGGPWYAWIYARDGARLKFSTRQRDKAAARAVLRERERNPPATADRPSPRRAPGPGQRRVEDALRYLVEESNAKAWPASTLRMFEQKAGHLFRALGDVLLAQLTTADVKRYIDQRLGEHVDRARTRTTSRETVRKELSTLRAALREAGELGWCAPGLERLSIPRFVAESKARDRRLSLDEVAALLPALIDTRRRSTAADLAARRRRWLMVALYLGGRLSEVERIGWEDLDLEARAVHLRGTKTRRADRHLPLAGPLADLLEQVPAADRTGPIAGAWPNVRRDLAQACARAGIPRCSPNDLRRTFASWLVNAKVPLKVIAELLGHSSTRMVDRVYGHVERDSMAAAAALLPALTMPDLPLPPIGAAARARRHWDKTGTTPMARMARMARSGDAASPTPAPPPSRNPAPPLDLLVPRDGVEPPTRGFSVRESEPVRPHLRLVSPRGGR